MEELDEWFEEVKRKTFLRLRFFLDYDFKVICNQETYYVHREIMKNNPYFEGLFRSGVEALTNTVVVSPTIFPGVTLGRILLYFYMRDIHLTNYNIHETSKAANYLQEEGILAHCGKFIYKDVTISNALEKLRCAQDYNIKELWTSIIDFIAERFEQFSQSNSFVIASFEVINSLLSSPKLKVYDEKSLIHTICEWMLRNVFENQNQVRMLFKKIKFDFLYPNPHKAAPISLLNDDMALVYLQQARECEENKANRLTLQQPDTLHRQPDTARDYWNGLYIFTYDMGLFHYSPERNETRVVNWSFPGLTNITDIWHQHVVQLNRKIYQVVNNKNVLHCFDPITKTYQSLPPMPKTPGNSKVCGHNGQLYVFDNLHTRTNKYLQIYSPETNCWRKVKLWWNKPMFAKDCRIKEKLVFVHSYGDHILIIKFTSIPRDVRFERVQREAYLLDPNTFKLTACGETFGLLSYYGKRMIRLFNHKQNLVVLHHDKYANIKIDVYDHFKEMTFYCEFQRNECLAHTVEVDGYVRNCGRDVKIDHHGDYLYFLDRCSETKQLNLMKVNLYTLVEEIDQTLFNITSIMERVEWNPSDFTFNEYTIWCGEFFPFSIHWI